MHQRHALCGMGLHIKEQWRKMFLDRGDIKLAHRKIFRTTPQPFSANLAVKWMLIQSKAK